MDKTFFKLNYKNTNKQLKQLKLTIIRGDLIQQKVDAIVNPTDEILSGGGGLDEVIHQDGKHGEPELLTRCYKNILQIARKNNLTTIAIPAISTGVFRYPFEEATPVVYDAIYQDLEKNGLGSLQEIRFVLWEQKKFDIYKRIFSSQTGVWDFIYPEHVRQAQCGRSRRIRSIRIC